MITFKKYFRLVKEDPDTVYINTPELKVETDYDTTQDDVYAFGFFNSTISYLDVKPFENLKELDGELVIGRGISHGIIKKSFFQKLNHGIVKTYNRNEELTTYDLSNTAQHKNFMDTSLMTEANSRIIFSPSGRIWTNLINKVNNQSVILISFWGFRDKMKNKDNDPSSFGSYNKTKASEGYEITGVKIKRILIMLNIPRDKWGDVYLEFLEDDTKGESNPRIQFKDFSRPSNVTPAETEEDKETIRKAQEKIKTGAHGNKLNPNFGSPSQAKKAEKAGLSSYAEYNAKRNPYGESVE
jgi:hypothetical protein